VRLTGNRARAQELTQETFIRAYRDGSIRLTLLPHEQGMVQSFHTTERGREMDQQLSIAAVVTAGWNPKEDDPLAQYAQGGPKAVIPIAGKPMIAHVVDALAQSRHVDRAVIVALDPSLGIRFSAPVDYLPDHGEIVANASAGIQYAFAHYPGIDAALLCGSDVPTITPVIVNDFIEACFRTDHEVYYSIVARSVMETRFPQSRRSYIHLHEGDFAGGDLLLFRPGVNFDHQALMAKLATVRKSALKQARLLGPVIFLRLVARRLSLAEAERRAQEIFEVRARAVPCPYAEVGMDVDKPFQLEIVRAELEARAASTAA
jgi:GTP:adenosylcobinamide-phosphate guanylyltransferase